MTLEHKMRALLLDMEWIWEPYDDFYHKDSGYRCHYCGAYMHEGHSQGCDMGEVISEIRGKENAQ